MQFAAAVTTQYAAVAVQYVAAAARNAADLLLVICYSKDQHLMWQFNEFAVFAAASRQPMDQGQGKLF